VGQVSRLQFEAYLLGQFERLMFLLRLDQVSIFFVISIAIPFMRCILIKIIKKYKSVNEGGRIQG
jgi:hypothetical protein